MLYLEIKYLKHIMITHTQALFAALHKLQCDHDGKSLQ